MSQFDNLLQSSIKKVKVRTQLTQEFVYDPWAPAGAPSEGENWLMNFIKPEIVVETSAGDVPLAPRGTPERDYSFVPFVGAGLMVIGLVTVIRWALKGKVMA